MNMRTAICLAAALLVATLPSLAFAQEQRGSIEGVVKDSTGGVLPGVTVEARSPSLVGTATAITDAQGIYRFPALAPGIYEITAALQGFAATRQERVALELGQIMKINLQLSPAALIESVTVTAESPLIDVKQNAAAATIDEEVIERIPKGRDFTTLVAFQAPGAQSESRNGGLQIDGSSGSENRFYIDGVDRTNLRTGLTGATQTNTGGGNPELVTDFIDQVVVKSSGYNAEHRAATGGTVSAITKTGSNTWRGSGGVYFNSDKLQGQERPELRLNPRDQTQAETIVRPPDDYSLWEPMLQIGGPLVRNRVWLFAGYVPRIRRDARTVTFQSNGQRATVNDDTEDHQVSYNVTSQLSKALRVKFAVSNERFYDGVINTNGRPTIEPDGTSTSNPALFPVALYEDQFDDSYVANVDYVASSRLYVNVTTGYWTYGTHGAGAGTTLRHSFGASNFQFGDIPDSLKNVNGFADAPVNSQTVFDDFSRLAFNTDATYFSSFWGQHSIKTGVQFERLANEVLNGAVAPNIALQWDATRAALDGRRVRGTYGYYTVTQNRREGDIAFKQRRSVRSGRLGGHQPAHVESRRQNRQAGHPLVQHGQSGDLFSFR